MGERGTVAAFSRNKYCIPAAAGELIFEIAQAYDDAVASRMARRTYNCPLTTDGQEIPAATRIMVHCGFSGVGVSSTEVQLWE